MDNVGMFLLLPRMNNQATLDNYTKEARVIFLFVLSINVWRRRARGRRVNNQLPPFVFINPNAEFVGVVGTRITMKKHLIFILLLFGCFYSIAHAQQNNNTYDEALSALKAKVIVTKALLPQYFGEGITLEDIGLHLKGDKFFSFGYRMKGYNLNGIEDDNPQIKEWIKENLLINDPSKKSLISNLVICNIPLMYGFYNEKDDLLIMCFYPDELKEILRKM